MNSRLPAEEDPFLHSHFSKLQQFTPRPGFEDRIMARVRPPATRRIRQLQEPMHSLTETGRIVVCRLPAREAKVDQEGRWLSL